MMGTIKRKFCAKCKKPRILAHYGIADGFKKPDAQLVCIYCTTADFTERLEKRCAARKHMRLMQVARRALRRKKDDNKLYRRRRRIREKNGGASLDS